MICGVVGAGALGRGFVTRLLQAGLGVLVHDLDVDAVAACVAEGAREAETVAQLGAVSDAVVLALPDTPEILAVTEELAGSLRPATLVLVMSTVAVETPRIVQRRLADTGAVVLDCPVSGGPARAATGELAIMVGGPEDAFLRAQPVLQALGSTIVHVGPLGHGEIAKLANNLMGAVIVQGIAEGLTLAAKAGADVTRVTEAIAAGSGSSWILREWLPDTLFRGDFARRFSLELMCKDMRLVDELAHELGVPVPAAEIARAAFERAVEGGYGHEDFSRAIALHAERAGTRLS